MSNALLATIDFEGRPETVSVFYEKALVGNPSITDVRCRGDSIFPTIRHNASMMDRLRVKLMKELSRRPFCEYEDDILSIFGKDKYNQP